MELKIKLPQEAVNQLKSYLHDRLEIAAVKAWETAVERLPAAGETPYSTGQLRQSIRFEQVDELAWDIVCPMNYGAFVEFGTGPRGSETGAMPDFENDPQPSIIYHNGEVLVTRWRGQILDIPFVRHTQGQAAQPFLRPALMEGMQKLVELLTE